MSVTEISKLVNRSRKTVYKWIEQGLPIDSGKISIQALVQWLVDERQTALDNAIKDAPLNELKKRKTEQEIRKLQLENKARENQFIDVKQLSAEWDVIGSILSNKLENIGRRLGGEEGVSLIAKAIKEADDAIKRTLYAAE